MLTQVNASSEKTLLKNVQILDVNQGKLTGPANVYVENGRIADVDAGAPSAGCDVIEGDGFTLVPGLINCHAHILSPYLSQQKGALSLWALRQMRRNFEHSLAAGVVCVKDMLSPIKVMNRIRNKVADGRYIGPDVLAGGPVLSCKDGYPEFIEPMYFPISAFAGQPKLNLTSPQHATAIVHALKRHGADHIKIGYTSYDRDFVSAKRMPVVSDEILDAICAAAHGIGLKVAVHHNWSEDMHVILRADIDSLEHLIYDRVITEDEVTLIKNKGITVVPTLSITDSMARFEEKLPFLKSPRAAEIFEKPALDHLTWIAETWLDFKGESYQKVFGVWRANREHYAGSLETARRLYAGGVPLAAGTDLGAVMVWPGELVDELKRFHSFGMSNIDAIRSATINAARFVDRGDRLGSIEAGKNADMFLVEGDPLEDLNALRRVRLVGKRGRWFRPSHPETPDYWMGSSPEFRG